MSCLLRCWDAGPSASSERAPAEASPGLSGRPAPLHTTRNSSSSERRTWASSAPGPAPPLAADACALRLPGRFVRARPPSAVCFLGFGEPRWRRRGWNGSAFRRRSSGGGSWPRRRRRPRARGAAQVRPRRAGGLVASLAATSRSRVAGGRGALVPPPPSLLPEHLRATRACALSAARRLGRTTAPTMPCRSFQGTRGLPPWGPSRKAALCPDLLRRRAGEGWGSWLAGRLEALLFPGVGLAWLGSACPAGSAGVAAADPPLAPSGDLLSWSA